jgi:hypothetical protein
MAIFKEKMYFEAELRLLHNPNRITALRKQRQEDHQFKASLDYIARPSKHTHTHAHQTNILVLMKI